MKQTFLFLILVLHIHLFAQTDNNISVISVEKTGILYRGISNPIKIAVPGAKSYKIRSNGKLEKLDSIGNYNLNVTGTSGREAKIWIDIVMPDGSTKLEEKKFRLDAIKHRTAYIDSPYQWKTYEMTHEQLKNLKISTLIEDLAFQTDTTYNRVELYKIKVEGRENIWIKGNRITLKAFAQIKDLPIGSEIFITEITAYNPHHYYWKAIQPIKIRIVQKGMQGLEPIVKSHFGNNIVYRGIENPLYIEVSNIKSFQIKGKGLSTMAKDSTYTINVSNIKEDRVYLDFEITDKNDSIFVTKELLYIKDITPKKITVNDKSCKNCILKMTLEELKNAIIDIKEDANESLASDVVWGFLINMPDGNSLEINGDRITDEALKKLTSLRKKAVIEILAPYYGSPFDPAPLKIMIIDKG